MKKSPVGCLSIYSDRVQRGGVGRLKRPDGVQDWHERIVDDVINSGLADHHLTGAYSTIGLKVIRAQG